jgi:hypothetical protein
MRLFYVMLFMAFLSVSGAQAQTRSTGFPDNGANSTVHYYPNPASSYITFEDISRKYDQSYSIQLFNFLGKKVYEFKLGDQKNIVNLTDFFRGIYIFQLRDPSGKIVESGKFQVNK